jgi:hypothetical protein
MWLHPGIMAARVGYLLGTRVHCVDTVLYYLTFLEATPLAASERFHAYSATWLSPVAAGGRR